MSIVINPYNFGGFHSKVLMLDLKSNLKLHSSYNLSWNNARLHVDIFHCAFKGTVALFTYNVKINRTCLYTEPHLKNITSTIYTNIGHQDKHHKLATAFYANKRLKL